MSNYYYRDNEGNWFVSKNGIFYPVSAELSGSMECAYLMGKMDLLEKQRRELNETVLQVRDTQMVTLDTA